MPGFSANYGEYNIAGSFNQWFVTNITANGVPTWMSSARVIFDWGIENPIISGHSGHAFGLAHLGNIPTMAYQGDNVDNGSAGHSRRGQVEINAWVSKQAAGNSHIARLRQMRDMIAVLFVNNHSFNIYNINAGTASPASLTARGVLDGIEFANPQADPINPDIWRVRAVAGYQWVERA